VRYTHRTVSVDVISLSDTTKSEGMGTGRERVGIPRQHVWVHS
jgi:hypothetical protein